MSNWVLVVEDECIGQIIFRKANDKDGDYGLSVTAYNEHAGYFAMSFFGFGDNKARMDEEFEKLSQEDGHETIIRIAEELLAI